MNPLMGLNKSKDSSDVSSSSVHKSKNKSKARHVDKQTTSSHPSSAYGSVKTPIRSPRSINETELASDSRSGRSEPKKFLIPQIVVTRASTETIHTAEDDVQRTIKDKIDYGPYYRHRNPSTVNAYNKTEAKGSKN